MPPSAKSNGPPIHLYRWNGLWWVSRNGYASWRKGITLNDTASPTFDRAAQAARSWWNFYNPSTGLPL